MKIKAIVSIIAVLATAALSAAVLWMLMVQPEGLEKIGLLGVFLASMLSHLTVVGRDLFVPMYVPLTSVYHPLFLGASAGIGAALGEVTTYLLGWGLSETLHNNQKDGRLAGWVRKYGLWAVLLVAVTPLPDTPLVLIAGSNRLPLGKLFAAECLGKTTLYSFGAVVGGFVFTGLSGIVGGIAASMLVVAASILFCMLVAWEKGRALVFGWFERLFL